ncbi:MAG: hypothetical protein IJB45_04595 [Clostridia bacterium]|nr:hypothetical protein [Clostridia bacterium]
MKQEKITDALALADEKFIAQADEFRQGIKSGKRKYAALIAAACVCIVAVASAVGIRYGTGNIGTENLPKISIDGLLDGGMGYEGWMLKDLSEWYSQKEINRFKTLPVFSDDEYYVETGNAKGLSEEELNRVINDAVHRLEIPEAECERKYEYASEIYGEVEEDYVYAIEAIVSGGRIRAFAKGGFNVIFNDGYTVPAGWSDQQIAEYFTERFKCLLGEGEIVTDIRTDYDIYGVRKVSYSFYEGSENELEEMINREFNSVYLNISEGRLMSIRVENSLALAEKIADYPVISLGEARKKLVSGEYITSSPYDFGGEECIESVELVYRRSGEIYAPYYLFYVEEINAPKKDYGLKGYSSYYVPAVEAEFVEYSGYGG